MNHQSLRHSQGNGIGLTSGTASSSNAPDVVLVHALGDLESPKSALAVVQTAKGLSQGLAVDQNLTFTLNQVCNSVTALSPANASSAAVLVDNTGLWLVVEWLDVTHVASESSCDFVWHEVGVDIVQSLQDLQNLCVTSGLDRLVAVDLVLSQSLPCNAGSMSSRQDGQCLVFAQQVLELQEVVGEVGLAGEI